MLGLVRPTVGGGAYFRRHGACHNGSGKKVLTSTTVEKLGGSNVDNCGDNVAHYEKSNPRF